MPPGSPFRRGPMNSDDLVGSAAVTAAAAAVQETRARMERVSSRADAAADPSSPPAPCHRADPGQPSSAKRRKSSAGTPAATPSSAGGAPSSAGGTAEKDGKGKGLRHFSMKVCEKVQSKIRRRTTRWRTSSWRSLATRTTRDSAPTRRTTRRTSGGGCTTR